jgi:hypothetical protein
LPYFAKNRSTIVVAPCASSPVWWKLNLMWSKAAYIDIVRYKPSRFNRTFCGAACIYQSHF